MASDNQGGRLLSASNEIDPHKFSGILLKYFFKVDPYLSFLKCDSSNDPFSIPAETEQASGTLEIKLKCVKTLSANLKLSTNGLFYTFVKPVLI